jgi:hypothetical protein
VQLGDVRSIRIAPGATEKVALNLMPANDALAIGGSGPSHVHCRLFGVQFADGSRWVASPPAQAGAASRGAATGVPQGVFLTTPIDGPAPIGFVHTQPGAALRLRSVQPTEAGLCGVAEVENLANVPITGIRFGYFTHTPTPGVEGSSLTSGSVGTSDLLPVDVTPQQVVTVDVGLLSRADLHERLRVAKAPVLCAVAEVRYANGATWRMEGHTMFGPEHAEVSRSQIGAPPTGDGSLCRDDKGGWYSEEAVVRIRMENSFVQCRAGTWREHQLPARPLPGG